MSNEISIRMSLGVNNPNANLRYQNQPSGFTASMIGVAGPTPGDILVSENGTEIPLSGLQHMGGWARILNKDTVNYVEIGVRDSSSIFYPLLELLPGEQIVVRLSRYIQQESVGTGTYEGSTNLLIRSSSGSGNVRVLVEAFDA